MSHYRLRKRSKGPDDPVEINVTPMIDMFSVLTAFLLMTAVFSSSGVIRVEIPFFSSKPPPTQEVLDATPERVVTVTIDNSEVIMDSSFTNTEEKAVRTLFPFTPKGLDDLQSKIYQIRVENKKFDRVTVMTLNDVPYEKLVQVLDTLRELSPTRAPIQLPIDYVVPSGIDRNALIPKIILGNVIL